MFATTSRYIPTDVNLHNEYVYSIIFPVYLCLFHKSFSEKLQLELTSNGIDIQFFLLISLLRAAELLPSHFPVGDENFFFAYGTNIHQKYPTCAHQQILLTLKVIQPALGVICSPSVSNIHEWIDLLVYYFAICLSFPVKFVIVFMFRFQPNSFYRRKCLDWARFLLIPSLVTSESCLRNIY